MMEIKKTSKFACFSFVLYLLLGQIFQSYVHAADIKGTVTIVSKIKKAAQGKKKKKGEYGGDDFLSKKGGSGSIAITDEAQQVVVFILETKKKTPPAKKNPLMSQKKRTFIPHVLPILAGSEVDFPNYDKIYHAVYSDSSAKKIELPEYANGDSRTVTFNKEGIVELFCGIHTNMNAYILVLQNPFFTMPDASHKYEINDVPPGEYTLKAWHPRLDTVEKKITVPASGVLTVDFKL